MKNNIYVFSDLHLNILEENRRESFLQFFDSVVASQASALYLNGDIIDIVAQLPSTQGLNVINDFFDILRRISQKGVQIIYNLGNHDLPLLFLSPKFRSIDQEFNAYASQYCGEILPNFIINYRFFTFSLDEIKVYMEHGHIYDLGWVMAEDWRERWLACGSIEFSNSIQENIESLWKIFGGHGEDYNARLARTNEHLPIFMDSIKAAHRILDLQNVDWVLLAHFHAPCVESFGNNKIYANSGDSLQHSNFLQIVDNTIHLRDWDQ